MDLAPNALTQDAQGVLSAISRQELVNLYVVSHTDRVTGRIKYVNREIETLQAQCAAEMADLYRSLFLAVARRVACSQLAVQTPVHHFQTVVVLEPEAAVPPTVPPMVR
jgi:hypothetical protein